MPKQFEVTILEDGRIKIDTDDMSGSIHIKVDRFVTDTIEDLGGEAETRKKRKTHTHTHNQHTHKH